MEAGSKIRNAEIARAHLNYLNHQGACAAQLRKEHPDVSKLPDAKQRWQELSAAYDALNDPAARSDDVGRSNHTQFDHK